MYQLATWAFSSGWSFEQVLSPSSTSATTNSRKQGLALPIFLPLANNSRTTILNQYSTSSILLLGGSVASDKTLLFASRLSTDSNAWSWDDIPSNFTKENIAGAATIFNTLVIVNGTIGNENGKYTVNLYDSTSFKPVKNLQSNTQDIPTPSSSSSSSTTTTTAAIVGTIVPVSAIVAAVAVTYFLMKKKKKNEDVDENFDYQIGNYYDQSTIGSKKLGIKNPFISGDRVNSNPYGHNHHMDTNSTLDVQSIDLWVRKRDEFEQNKKLNVPNHNPSFLASSETLSSTESDATRLTNPFEGAISNGAVPVSDESDSSGTPVTKTPILAAAPFTPATPGAGSKSILSSPLIDRSVSRLRKSLSFSTPQPYGLLKRKSTYASKKSSRTPTLFDDEFAYDSDERQIYEGSEGKGDIEREGEGEGEREGEMEESEKKNNEDEDEDDDKSFDDNVDVQVLVSSKRRSVLRVVNPDLETVAEEESLRQRIPSGPIDPEL